jgi:hypothetical protein
MASFPLLSTNAVAQYPVGISTIQESRVIHFLDGADQRYLAKKRPMRSWQVKLDLLIEAEMLALEIFFGEQMGVYSTFSFPDPYTGTVVPNCRLATGLLTSEFLGVEACGTTITVVETNG